MFIFLCAAALGLLLLGGVVSPLMKTRAWEQKSEAVGEATDFLRVRPLDEGEVELTEQLGLRDQLLNELTQAHPSQDKSMGPKTPDSACPPEQNSWDQKLEKVVDICLALKRQGLPYLALLWAALTTVTLEPALYGSTAWAQDAVEASPQPQLDIKIPTGLPLSKDPHGKTFVPRVNQFILYPMQGKLMVQYFAMLQPTQTPTETILLPFPVGFGALEVTQPVGALVKPLSLESGVQMPVITVPSGGGLIQVRAQFELPAPLGTVQWKGAPGVNLPGMALLIMPEYPGLLRTIIEKNFPQANVWPARILGIPAGFERERVFEIFNPEHPIIKQLSNPPKQKMIRFMRVGTLVSDYPTFSVTGLVPERNYLNGIGVFFGSLLFGILIFVNILLPRINKK